MPAPGGRHVASMIYTTAPGLGVDLGSRWTFDYTPLWTTYTARALEDTLDHSAQLSGVQRVGEWALQFSENYALSTPILFETGQQTKQTTWGTQLSASRTIGTKLAISSSASLNERYGESFPDTRDWSTMHWLTLRSGKQFETGLGFGAGYTDIVARPDGTNERYLGRINWNPTDKLKVALDGGLEVRHSRAAGAEDMRNPILNATLSYQPFTTTSVNLGAARTVTSSYFDRQVTVGSSWNIGLQQRLLGHFYLNAGYSQQDNSFDAGTTTLVPVVLPDAPPLDPVIISQPGRSDRTEVISGSLTLQLFKRLGLSVTYQRSKNQSSQSAFGFTTTQYGFEVSCRY
jgi:hypothetical protein